ncbi:hypothetical protein MNBD_PLANCTO02-1764 [hydrothermal vent metagenome]|uniref:Phosphate regulon transcriptional regulatory protein PhoB (SphR) n=1 Tax=hydrothermal vent metagenome TaxID=652676 RepID=A0A3B1DMR0_9ZZZZ
MRILIVEDETALADGLKYNFVQEGYDVVVANNGDTALDYFHDTKYPIDLVVLDLMLPGMSGYDICQTIRSKDQQIPIIVLSARRLSEDKTEAFDCGTDQYITKPFALSELLSRVRNLLERRSRQQPVEVSPPKEKLSHYEFSNVRLDFTTYQMTVGKQVYPLTVIELELMRYFIENEGTVLSRKDILENVWGETADITTRSIDNFVMRLRKFIEKDPSQPVHILSVRGIGYRFLFTPEQEISKK